MRYYLYISDSKLEMLYEQVPIDARLKIASRLEINLGIVRASFQTETVVNARHQKILIVEEYLGNRISPMREARPYVAGIARAAWGPFGDYRSVVYFGGHSNGVHFGLMGSLSNCIGAPNSEPTGHSLSAYVVHTLAKRKLLPPRTPTSFCKDVPADELNQRALEGVMMANRCCLTPKENIEFLARTVISRSASDEHPAVYLGSPIYVAAYDGV